MALLNAFRRRSFALPPFELASLHFESEAEDVLLLDRVVQPSADDKVITLRQAIPTPGELSETIDQHLAAASVAGRRPDAADELRSALADLRRSLG